MSFNAAIVGPGRSKQGTGPYIARTLHQLDIDIKGVVSSSYESANLAAKNLQNDYAITCHAYNNLEELLNQHAIDILVISSPIASHYDFLQKAVDANCHIFCEKPLWWPAQDVTTFEDIETITQQTIALVQSCKQKNIVLQLNTQWPFTLPTYYELYPNLKNDINAFSMWLSPQSDGRNMILDAVPHLLSMMYAIVGTGRLQNIQHTSSDDTELNIEFDYLHAYGDVKVSLILKSCTTQPKPAAYAINQQRVDRHVDASNYLISLHTEDKQLPIIDPLTCSIKNFISTIYSQSSADDITLIDGMTHLAQVYQAVTAK